MNIILEVLSTVLNTLLRLEHKVDVIITAHKNAGNILYAPRMSSNNIDAITGLPVEYKASSYKENPEREFVERIPTDQPNIEERIYHA